MPANSFQNQLTPDGKYAVPAGELHLLDEGDRNTSWDINVNPTTSWVEHDLSGRVPKGTKALLGICWVVNADNFGNLQARDGVSTETDLERTHLIAHYQGAGDIIAVPIIVKATDGIFDIQERSAIYEVSTFAFNLWGYYL